MIIDAFKMLDYAEIELANGLGFEHWGLSCGVVNVLGMMENSGTYWTLRKEGAVVCIGGYSQLYTGVCEAAFFPSRQFVDSPRLALLAVKERVRGWANTFRRVQMNCRSDKKFIRFAEHLGFEKEGVLRKFSPDGTDHVLMAIVR